jgi:hypothetical protein
LFCGLPSTRDSIANFLSIHHHTFTSTTHTHISAMSEVQSRPAASRGRGSGRGGRGGFAARGGSRAGTRPNGDSKHDTDSSLPTLEDEGEIGQLKQKYGSKVELIKEMFPDWSSVDILFALQETDGDESVAVTRMAEGKLTSRLFWLRHATVPFSILLFLSSTASRR